jgi:predicted RNA binding protein YcfA (HicA-like mRNA interferase family)
MGKRDKLIEALRANPKTVRFDEACKLALLLGFQHQAGKGSHRVFKRKGEIVQLNFQNKNGVIPHYQALQLIAMLERYWADI